MAQYRKYAFIFHCSDKFQETMYEAAQCDAATEMQAVIKLLRWASRRVSSCEIPGCGCKDNTMTISSQKIPEMEAAGAYKNIVEIK